MVDAQLVADWFQGNGVPCEIFNQNAMGALGELPVSPPEVWVRRNDDLPLAMRLLEQVIFIEDDGEQACPQCGELSPIGYLLAMSVADKADLKWPLRKRKR